MLTFTLKQTLKLKCCSEPDQGLWTIPSWFQNSHKSTIVTLAFISPHPSQFTPTTFSNVLVSLMTLFLINSGSSLKLLSARNRAVVIVVTIGFKQEFSGNTINATIASTYTEVWNMDTKDKSAISNKAIKLVRITAPILISTCFVFSSRFEILLDLVMLNIMIVYKIQTAENSRILMQA